MKELLRLGAQVDDRDYNLGNTALDLAILSSDIYGSPKRVYKSVELLLQHGGSTRSVEGRPGSFGPKPSAIWNACSCYAPVSVIRLLATASPSEVDEKVGGITPLHEVSRFTDEDTLSKVQALIESGADLHIEEGHRDKVMGCCRTALAESLFVLNWAVAKYLLEQASSMEFGNNGNHKHSVLHLLVFKAFILEARNRPGEIAGLVSTVERLLDHPAARQKDLLNAVNFGGVSPVRMAVYYGLPRLLKILLKTCYGSCTDISDIAEGRVSLIEYFKVTFQAELKKGPRFVVTDDADIDGEQCEIGGDLVPYIKVSEYRKRLEDVKEILKSRLLGSDKQPLRLTSF